jgi:hypothetical protein
LSCPFTGGAGPYCNLYLLPTLADVDVVVAFVSTVVATPLSAKSILPAAEPEALQLLKVENMALPLQWPVHSV